MQREAPRHCSRTRSRRRCRTSCHQTTGNLIGPLRGTLANGLFTRLRIWLHAVKREYSLLAGIGHGGVHLIRLAVSYQPAITSGHNDAR
jgi:hypothetical protein